MDDLRLQASVEVADALRSFDLLDKRLAAYQQQKASRINLDTSPALNALKTLESQYAATQARLKAQAPVVGGLLGPNGQPVSSTPAQAPQAPSTTGIQSLHSRIRSTLSGRGA